MNVEPEINLDDTEFDDVQDDLEILATDLELEAEKEEKKGVAKTHDPLAVLYKHHPEAILDYTETILSKLPLVTAPPGTGGAIVDVNHKSMPFLTQYEKTSILGFRADQLAQGARPFIVVPPHITSTLEIARIELEQRRLPFIVKRPMPDASFEYWRLSDLMIL